MPAGQPPPWARTAALALGAGALLYALYRLFRNDGGTPPPALAENERDNNHGKAPAAPLPAADPATPPRPSSSAAAADSADSADSATFVRAAFDIGSGATKVLVARVDRATLAVVSRPPLYQGYREVLLRHALTADGELPAAALNQCLQVLREFVAEANALGASERVAVATAVFREARNGGAFLDRVRAELGIRVVVASQRFEGTLGYRTAVQAASATSRQHALASPSVRRRHSLGSLQRAIVSWDSGGGSFQITNAAGDMYGGPVGSSTSLQIMMRLQGRAFVDRGSQVEKGGVPQAMARRLPSANPCTIAHCTHLQTHLLAQAGDDGDAGSETKSGRASSPLLPAVAGWLSEALGGTAARVVAIGGDTCAFRMAEMATGQSVFGPQDVWEAVEHHAGMDDGDLAALGFPQPEMLLPKLVLVHTVMVHTGMSRVEYHPTIGSTLGLLATPWSELKAHAAEQAAAR